MGKKSNRSGNKRKNKSTPPLPGGSGDPEYQKYLEQFKKYKESSQTTGGPTTEIEGDRTVGRGPTTTTISTTSSPANEGEYAEPPGASGSTGKPGVTVKSAEAGGEDSSAKKVGKQEVEFEFNTAFDLALPLSYEQWKQVKEQNPDLLKPPEPKPQEETPEAAEQPVAPEQPKPAEPPTPAAPPPKPKEAEPPTPLEAPSAPETEEETGLPPETAKPKLPKPRQKKRGSQRKPPTEPSLAPDNFLRDLMENDLGEKLPPLTPNEQQAQNDLNRARQKREQKSKRPTPAEELSRPPITEPRELVRQDEAGHPIQPGAEPNKLNEEGQQNAGNDMEAAKKKSGSFGERFHENVSDFRDDTKRGVNTVLASTVGNVKRIKNRRRINALKKQQKKKADEIKDLQKKKDKIKKKIRKEIFRLFGEIISGVGIIAAIYEWYKNSKLRFELAETNRKIHVAKYDIKKIEQQIYNLSNALRVATDEEKTVKLEERQAEQKPNANLPSPSTQPKAPATPTVGADATKNTKTGANSNNQASQPNKKATTGASSARQQPPQSRATPPASPKPNQTAPTAGQQPKTPPPPIKGMFGDVFKNAAEQASQPRGPQTPATGADVFDDFQRGLKHDKIDKAKNNPPPNSPPPTRPKPEVPVNVPRLPRPASQRPPRQGPPVQPSASL